MIPISEQKIRCMYMMWCDKLRGVGDMNVWAVYMGWDLKSEYLSICNLCTVIVINRKRSWTKDMVELGGEQAHACYLPPRRSPTTHHIHCSTAASSMVSQPSSRFATSCGSNNNMCSMLGNDCWFGEGDAIGVLPWEVLGGPMGTI